MKRFSSLIVLFTLSLFTLAQSPGKMSYQAVVRHTSGELVKNSIIGMQISILQGDVNGTKVYSETQRPTTNANGLVSIIIGDGNIVTGSLVSIDWSDGPYFIKTETDPTGGTNYSITGTSQLLSVPYAFHATTAESLTNPTEETDPTFSVWDKSTGIKITESQVTDLKHFSNADETDPQYAADSSFIKAGVRSWNNSLAKTIDTGDTSRWGKVYTETDPLFSAWDKSAGITINQSQITGFDPFTTTDETDPVFKQSVAKGITQADTVRWNDKSSFSGNYQDLHNKPLALSQFTNDVGFQRSGDDEDVSSTNEIQTLYADPTNNQIGLSSGGGTVRVTDVEGDPKFSSWNKREGITIQEAQIIDLDHFTNADETDPKFSAWNKREGITIQEAQIIDLDHFKNSDETDQVYATDSSFVKSGVRSWNSSLAKTIDAADTTFWGRDETDPFYSADSSFIKSGVRSWNSSLAKTIDAYDTTRWGSDLHYAADSSFIKSGVRSWNNSLSKTIDATDTTYWGRAETDPFYSTDSSYIKSAVRNWNSSLAKKITTTDTAYWNNKSDFDGNYSSLTNAPDIAVSTTNKNINLASGQTFSIKDDSYTYLRVNQSTGFTGIGSNATSPRAQLEIGGYEGLLCTGTANQGTARALGAGMRFHWYPRRGALRAGMAESFWWDDNGSTSPKLALYSCAIGYQPRASGVASNAIGAYNQATGDYALSLGSYCYATASHAIAIGTHVFATGIYSTAMGAGADTNGKDGSMVVGDDTYFQTAYASADNQLTMRFSGGYRLWSSYPDSTAGVYMRHGQSGWSNYCDRNMKENFKKLNYEEVLKKIDEQVPITEWNYKKTDTTSRYIGPMAQDFYKAFQLGGDDSLGINSINEMGVSLAAIHGLIDRTDALKATVEELKLEKQKNALLQAMFNEQNSVILQMRKELDEIKAEVSKYATKEKKIVAEPEANNSTR